MRAIGSDRIVKMYGMRAKIGTFDKHNPRCIYVDATININGTKELKLMREVRDLIDDALFSWIQGQESYDRKHYVKIVDIPESSTKTTYNSMTNHLHFDLSLLQKQPHRWDETVEIAAKHLGELYESIASSVTGKGLTLQDFRGYNYKTGDYAT